MTQFHPERPEVPRLPDQARSIDKSQTRQMPRYKVILHRDPGNDLMFVVRIVMELIRFPRAEATHKMWEAQHRGFSVLLQTYFERAELYVEQFGSRNLKVTLEPA